MAIQYSGFVEVPRSENKGGGTVRIPFNFFSRDILSSSERQERAREIFANFRALITDYDPTRTEDYGDIIRMRFTSVIEVPVAGDDPYSGVPLPEPHIGR